MIDSLIMHTLNGYAYVRKHPQILTTVLLIAVIPIAFLFSGQQFLNAAKDNQERLEKERIGSIQDMFASLLTISAFDTQIIQDEIVHFTQNNTDITKFRVAKELGTDIVVIAALDESTIGFVDSDNYYRVGNINPAESLVIPFVVNGERFWQSYKLVQSDEGVRYYVFIETSLKRIDSLFAHRILSAYYWLIAILIIVLLLVVRHVRLIDYAYLYTETKKANEMKDLFTNMIAHELRAPLTAIRGYASMVREHPEQTKETSEYIARIENSASRLLFIVNDLLDVARIHSGKLSMSYAKTNVQNVLISVLKEMQISAKEKNITLTKEGDKNEVYIETDEKRLHQALTNLVSNSIKYTKAGEISLAIEARNDRIEIRVKDTGMGISAADQKNLFAPFFRVENIEVHQTVGTGLGMWITKQLIELMHGSIAVESIKSVGTHIVVTLPRKMT